MEQTPEPGEGWRGTDKMGRVERGFGRWRRRDFVTPGFNEIYSFPPSSASGLSFQRETRRARSQESYKRLTDTLFPRGGWTVQRPHDVRR